MGRFFYDGFGYPPYVSVAQRRANAAKEVAKRTKKGQKISPVTIPGRKITTTFWGNAWCQNLEGYSDFENRLPRGRAYVRNGSVIDLQLDQGGITALVSGSDIYKIQIDVAPLSRDRWKDLKQRCAGQIGSLVELLQGRLSKGVMELVTNRDQGLFPKPKEITMRCSCPDYAGLCKHLAAVLYGVGHRLDASPELLFSLRAVDHQELIEQAVPSSSSPSSGPSHKLASDDLSALFGIDLDASAVPAKRKTRSTRTAKPSSTPVPSDENAEKKTAVKKKAAPKRAAKKKAVPKKKKASAAKKKGPIKKKKREAKKKPSNRRSDLE